MAEKEERRRFWISPNKRAKGYSQELKEQVHIYGKKKGEALTQKDVDRRIGYFMSRNDEAGIYRFKQALDAGLSYDQAANFSREIGTKLPEKTKGGKK